MNLLYPNGEMQTKKLSDDAYKHLAVEELVEMIGVTSEEKALVRNVVSVIPQDVETVLYRQEVLKDFLTDESFCDELAGILGDLDILKEYNERNFFTIRKKSSLWDMINYMEEMEVYVRVLEGLTQFFAAHEVNSEGLKEVSKLLQDSLLRLDTRCVTESHPNS